MAVMSEHEFCIKLVRAIEKYDCLYNNKVPEYTRKDIVEQTWNEVAFEVNVDAAKCKNKWRNIRTVFMRHLKQGNGKRNKPYYLRRRLQFLIPFLKPASFEIKEDTLSNISSELDQLNLPSPLSSEFVGTEIEDEYFDESNNDDDDENGEAAINMKQEPSPTLELEQETKRKICHENWGGGVSKKKKPLEISEVNASSSNTCNCHSNRETEEDPKKAFLTSLLPDLRSLNDKEMRQFKRKTLEIIDDIIDSRPTLNVSNHSDTTSKYEFITINT